MCQTIIIPLISFVASFFSFRIMIPALKRAGIVGKDMHKPGQPEVVEMGGVVTAIGFGAGIVVAIGLKSFVGLFSSVDLLPMVAAFSTILIVVLI